MPEYANPVDQVMFILGFKRDPRFVTILDATAVGAPSGVTDAADEIEIHGAVRGNMCGLAEMVQKVKDDFGADIPIAVKQEIHKIILDELTEDNFGGRWYDRASVPTNNWVRMDQFSSTFSREMDVFCLPEPYVRLVRMVI